MLEAETQWCQWEMQRDEDASIFWMLHEGALYIRVAIKFSLNFRTTTVRQNRADALLTSVKTTDGQTVANEAAKLAQDMNKFGEVDIDIMKYAHSAVRAGGMPTD